ncbi:unnamed protein product [Rotaria magnacalcarata]|uniref:Uncharacterized protein n=1 Tax=Rotaria magnacalcarata TaxID=392030 RepID=A0A816QF09_9BILA|nr:unnamed protein product [Rotaria magnacalcarata]CAF4348078.1 unnamed protein product [Rotaria magnacalcarata]
MVNELTPSWGKVHRVHHSHLRPWISRPNYLAAFDLGGEVFPPAAQLNKTNKNINTFGNGVISNTHANNFNRNNFIGFVPSVISIPPIGGGGANLPPSLNSAAPSFSLAPPVSVVAPPLNSAVLPNVPTRVIGGGVPLTPRPPLVYNIVGSSTPINVNFIPTPLNMSPVADNSKSVNNTAMPNENIITPINTENNENMINDLNNSLSNLGESNLDLDPFSGFPSLDSSDERTLSRIEALLENPGGLSFANNSIIDPPINIHVPPINVVPEVINIPAENLSPARTNRSRLPVPIVVESPPNTRLRRSNPKPSGFYKD